MDAILARPKYDWLRALKARGFVSCVTVNGELMATATEEVTLSPEQLSNSSCSLLNNLSSHGDGVDLTAENGLAHDVGATVG